jgi:uncharacterized protein YdhG (YjbR/CyaY superfamily)
VFTDYFSKITKDQRLQLERVMSIVIEMVPDATEVISYGIPGYNYKGKYLLGFAAFKNHMSIFPTAMPIENLKEKLTGYKTARGTIQFTSDNPLPESLIKEIVKNRLLGITKELP